MTARPTTVDLGGLDEPVLDGAGKTAAEATSMIVLTQSQPTAAFRPRSTPAASPASIELYWLPLGAGGWFVRLNGRIYEAIHALLERRRPFDLYHTALVVRVPEGRFVIENCWPIPDADGPSRGVLVEGPVGSRRTAPWRVFRYEVRRWRDGVITDADEAVASPQLLSDDPVLARRLLDLVGSLPNPVWGRDELGTGEMWNSNSVISWLLARSGLPTGAIRPPAGGRAPGWKAGLVTAHRQQWSHERSTGTFGSTAPGRSARVARPDATYRPRQQTSPRKGAIMKAAVVHRFKAPLQVEEVPIPEPGPGEILVKVEAAGLCHTDIHAAHGDWPVKPKLPLIPGHEGVGIVAALGPGVSEVAEGDRVAIPWLGWACGACEYCASGWETLCPSQQRTGYSVDGSYAEYVKASARFVGHVPNGVDPFEAAPLTCAGVTTWKAVKLAKLRPSGLVAVYGIGGLGHLALQYAKIAGATVAAVDLVDDKLKLALELGADYTIDARDEDPAAAIRWLGGADAAIVLAAAPAACEQAFRSLRPGGRLVLVGLPADNEMRLPVFETVLQGITVVGSIVGTRVDLAEVFELHARGHTKVIYQKRPLASVNEAFGDVLAGRTPARVVLCP